MHPITAIEAAGSIVLMVVIFLTALLLPKQMRKLSLLIASLLTALLFLFFIIRPYWVDYQVSIKSEQLNQYLEEKYPNQEWMISRGEGRQYNPYHLEVTFESEKGWIYTYSVVNEKNICQSVWTPPEGKFPQEGKHYERNHCK